MITMAEFQFRFKNAMWLEYYLGTIMVRQSIEIQSIPRVGSQQLPAQNLFL